jgi:penicillin-binding protein 1A
VHFKTSQTGEGSRTALPIFGKFMEKVYKDASLGIKPGPFPKPGVKITRKYLCETVYSKPDTAAIDSAFIDSLYIPFESTDSAEIPALPIKSN